MQRVYELQSRGMPHRAFVLRSPEHSSRVCSSTKHAFAASKAGSGPSVGKRERHLCCQNRGVFVAAQAATGATHCRQYA